MADPTTLIKHRKPDGAEKSRARIPCLVVIEGNDLGAIHPIDKSSVVIGRGDSSDIRLRDEGISRKHARIDQQEDAFTLVDLGSTNGTLVNGDQISQVVLHEGDKLRLGEVLLRFSYHDAMDVKFQENLRTMALRDGLTKAYNQRYFRETLEREFNFALRQRNPLSVILLDIDHFKKTNDTYGHVAGDSVLCSIVVTISNIVRGYDVLARYGGEEFGIILRSTALENALILAERVRVLVEALEVKAEGKTIKSTVSLGVAALDPDHAGTAEDLLKEADRYLYEAKEKGRNRVRSSRGKN